MHERDCADTVIGATRALAASSVVTSASSQPVFGEAEHLLLDEARARFEFEMKSTGTLHSKSTLFLTLTGVFAAFLTSSVGRLLDHGQRSFLEGAALVIFATCLGMLTIAALLLGRSALSRSYQIPAVPSRWAERLWHLKQRYVGTADADAKALAHLNYDLLDAWLEAAEECAKRNEFKSRELERVWRLLSIAVPTSLVGLTLMLLNAIRR